jgi:hypothetical protein
MSMHGQAPIGNGIPGRVDFPAGLQELVLVLARIELICLTSSMLLPGYLVFY